MGEVYSKKGYEYPTAAKAAVGASGKPLAPTWASYVAMYLAL
jgi:hypothetical protein